MPDLVLTTDIIVGFPGETEAMFQDTLNLLKRVQYDMAYTFIYSPRTGTPAATMDGQIPQEEKSRRLQRLMDVQNVYSLQKNKEMENQVYDVIVEGPTKNDAHHWFGRTTGNKMISGKMTELLPSAIPSPLPSIKDRPGFSKAT